MGVRSRSFLLTIPFKYNDRIVKIKDIVNMYDPFDFLVLQLERGKETQYKHYQCYVEYANARSVESIKKIFKPTHIEVRRGSQKEAYNYCTKKETRLHGPFEFGQKPIFNEKSTNSGLKEKFVKAIMNGATDIDLLLNFPSIFKKSVVDEYRDILGIKNPFLINNRDIEVSYIFGKSGVGKSSFIRRIHKPQDIYVVTDYDKDPFGSYKGQNVIIFEEYRSQFTLSNLLQYLDIYPCELPSRYNNKIAQYTKVYVISNWTLQQQYSSVEPLDKQALYRRFKYRYEINQEYIYRYEYDKQANLINKSYVLNPLGSKSKTFPLLPTMFDDLIEIKE